MLLRFTAKNLFSFKEETEFNLLPNRSTNLPHHKIVKNNISVLRLSAVYGANGSGKSNLVKGIELLSRIIIKGTISVVPKEVKFKLSHKSQEDPTSLSLEFFCGLHTYFYSITFDKGQILYEYFAESQIEKDILIFEREILNGKQTIRFFEEYYKDPKNSFFAEVLAEKLINKDDVLLSFLANKYENEFSDTKNVMEWFRSNLIIIKPNTKPDVIADILDKDESVKKFANDLLPSLSTGVASIDVLKESFSENEENSISGIDKDILKALLSRTSELPDGVLPIFSTRDGIAVVKENGNVVIKRLVTSHESIEGGLVPFNITLESDGTRRLIEYIPALQKIIYKEKVFLIDEIERSIHPLMIKEIIKKISHDDQVKGQLIFTTHESCLLDQNILRTDEIWFSQKDVDGSSKMYSLSDYKVHNTINIENGYLNGRYGGIPFLSNLKDLNWHKDEIFDKE
ncbi:ATP-binding protein [Chitinophaga sp. LS1]|uniref:AAA family ATPase n=1 Tax=Chitinophaga sp. LS1 TaxID=3051176 RepID=UPI002AAB5F6C|nr:ATP-binding protein [Chitinophaga sp. LS1]WPV67739.1 ATP-binding protein [Chitinophaga sp. LS1]